MTMAVTLSSQARLKLSRQTTRLSPEFSGLRIVATSDGYDSTSNARKVHRGFKGLMNEIFLDDLRERVHRGLAGQAMKHYWRRQTVWLSTEVGARCFAARCLWAAIPYRHGA